MLDSHFKLAKQLSAEIVTLTGKSISGELSRFDQKRHLTQIIIGHAAHTRLQTLIIGSTVTKLLKKNKNLEIHVIPYDL